MMKTAARLLLFVVAVVLVMSSDTFAGRPDKAGTSAAPMLLIPVGGRDVALGGAALATTMGIDAVYYNPGGLAFSDKKTEAMFSHMSYLADIGVEYLGLSSTFEGFGTLAFTLKSMAIGDIAVTTEALPDGSGETFTPRFSVMGVTYSRALTDRIGVGLTVNFVSEQIDRVSTSGVSFNFGVQYHNFAGMDGFNIGVAIKNFGPQMQYDGPGLLRQGQMDGLLRPTSFYNLVAAKAELPSVIELGLGYNLALGDKMMLSASGLFQNQNFFDDEYKLGAEISYDKTFFIRGGYDMAPKAEVDTYIWGPTFGAGLSQDFDGLGFTVDYAYQTAKYFGANHVFTLKLGF
ncbi:MAG: PorV/PorQ family protein [Ignavibacteriales bacterium]|nr:PorV/PorQ family protein [Ignavibacteriales bacterium]